MTHRLMLAATLLTLLTLSFPTGGAWADTPDKLTAGNALAGQSLAKNLCSACHALDAGKPSPNQAAPNFNTLTLTYPPEHLAEGFAEGILVGTDAHIGMPEFELAPEQIDDLIAYLETVMPPHVPPDAAEDGETN